MSTLSLQPYQKKKVRKINWNNFLIGTCISFVTQPFEVLRTSSIINKTNNNGTSFSDLRRQIGKIWSSEGIQGFYRGSTLAVIKSTLGAGIFFTGLENARYLFNVKNAKSFYGEQTLNFFSGCAAKLISTLIVTPVNVMKTRFEVVGQQEYLSITSSFAKVQKEEGIQGFYRGLIPTLIRGLPASGFQFTIYNSLIQYYEYAYKQSIQNSISYILFAGSISSGLTLFLFFPLDNIRVRYQGKKLEKRSMLTLIKQVYREQGLFGFYRGYLPILIKKSTSGALSWGLYEKLNKRRNDVLKLH